MESSRKLQQLLNITLDADSQNALENLAEFTKNEGIASSDIQKQRLFLADIERRIISVNKSYIDAFTPVVTDLNAVDVQVAELNVKCDEIHFKYDDAAMKISALVRKTQEIKNEIEQIKSKKLIVEAFIKQFTLSEEEIKIITNHTSPINEKFFDALNHLLQIETDCKSLLSVDNPSAGVDIMDSTAKYQGIAYDRLFKWAQLEFRSLNGDIPEISASLRLTMKALRQRPVFFQACVDEILQIRNKAIAQAFLNALTRGGPGGTPRPIEIHVPDPLRYVGDMLAWLHQTTATEKEMLEGLFGARSDPKKPDPESISFSRVLSSTSSYSLPGEVEETDESNVDEKLANELAIQSILDHTMEGTCNLLMVRVDQVFASHPGPITSYHIANLVQFYHSTIVKLLGNNAKLSDALLEILESAHKSFFEALQVQATNMINLPPTPTPDLLPPLIVKDAISQLKEIMQTYTSSLVPESMRETDFSSICSAIIEPIQEVCFLSASKLELPDQAVFLLNCFDVLHELLAKYSFTQIQAKHIEGEIEKQVEILVLNQYQNLLVESQLAPLIKSIELNVDQKPVSTLPHMDPDSITLSMNAFDLFLCSTQLDLTSGLSELTSTQHAREIANRQLLKLVEAYKVLYHTVMDEKNGYENPETLMVRSVGDVETLLAINIDDYEYM